MLHYNVEVGIFVSSAPRSSDLGRLNSLVEDNVAVRKVSENGDVETVLCSRRSVRASGTCDSVWVYSSRSTYTEDFEVILADRRGIRGGHDTCSSQNERDEVEGVHYEYLNGGFFEKKLFLLLKYV